MATNEKSDYESHFQVTTPPPSSPSPKKKRAPATPAATIGDGAGNESAGGVSLPEARLLIEMLLSSGPTKFDWAAISAKLEFPSAGATAKRAERLLKRFELKMSDVSGGNARTPKNNNNGDGATPRGKRKTGGGPESPTKRPGRAQATGKNDLPAKEEYDDENEAGSGVAI